MKIEVLLSTMFYEYEPDDFLSHMNIQSDIIIGNQCDCDENRTLAYNGNIVKILSRSERGVGKNRNNCLFNSYADIVMFADNDVCYYGGYKEKIEEYYKKNPKADMVIFNFKEKRGDEPIHDINVLNKKARLKDLTKFGTWAITAKRESIIKKRISFSLLFGGGSKFSMGEDSLFLNDCYKAGLNIYLSDITLGEVIHKESTWFKGINEKYVSDRGALFRAMSPKMYKFIILWHVLKHRDLYSNFGNSKTIKKIMLKGAKKYELYGAL